MYGRTDESMWYVNKIVQTFNKVLPGSISEMMPNYGDFTQAWTSYGIILPVVEHVFGIHPDAVNKSVLIEPHLPGGWENMSIDNLPIGTNTVSFSRSVTSRGIEYVVKSNQAGWNYVLKLPEKGEAKYYLNGKKIVSRSNEIKMNAKSNTVLVVPSNRPEK